MKKIAILFVTLFSILVSGVSLSFAQQVAVPTLYTGDVDPNGEAQTGSQCTILKSTNLRYLSTDKNTNNEVYALQVFLVDQGYLNAEPVDPTVDPKVFNTFRKGTLAAVKAFQKDNRLLNSGYVGNLTKAKIQSISCNGTTDPISSIGTSRIGVINPVLCTQEVKICDDGTAVGRAGPNCEFTCPTQPPLPGTSIPNVVVIGTPSFNRQYDALNKEVALNASANFTITAGSVDLYLAATNLTISNRAGQAVSVNSIKGSVAPISPNSPSVTGQYGNTFYKIPQGQKVTFAVATTVNPKQMFAGVYSASLKGVGVHTNPNDLNQGYIQLDAPTNQSQSITVVGETSPYISSVTTDANGLVRISGSRLNLSGNRWFVDGTQEIAQIKGDATYASFNPVNFNLSSGYHALSIVNTQTGNSNTVGFNVGDSVPTTTSAPTVEFLGTPTLNLQYDSVGKESILYGKVYVKITTGNNPITLYQNSVPGVLQFNKNGTGATYSNGMKFSSISASGLPSVPVTSGVVLPPNTSSTFVITNSAPTKELFAGTYFMSLSGFQYIDSSNNYQTVQSTSFINGAQSNSVTIVGETSPYISSVTTDANGLVRISGARLNLSGNRWFVDGTQEIAQIKGDATYASFNPVNFNLSSGSHTLKIVNAQTGDSNSWGFNVTTGQPTGINVLYPTSGLIFTKGQPITISWINTGPNKNYTLGYSASLPEGKGSIRSYTAAEANCDAADKCYVSWTPTFTSSNTTVFVSDPVSGVSGTSGNFAVISGTQTDTPVISYMTPTRGVGGDKFTIYGSGFNSTTEVDYFADDAMTISLGSNGQGWNLSTAPDGKSLNVTMLTLSSVPKKIRVSNNHGMIGVPFVYSNAISFNLTNTSVAKPDVSFSVNPQVISADRGDVYVSWSARDATNCIATSSPYLSTWSSPSLGLSGSRTVLGLSQTTMLYVICSNGTSGLSTSQGVQVRFPTTSTTGAPSIARTAGFVAQTVSPNTSGIKIASFTIQSPTTNGIIIYNISPTLYVNGYTLDNLSNITLRGINSFGVQTVLGVPIGRLSNNSPVFTFPDILVDAGQTRTFDVYADIGNASVGSVNTSMNVGYRTANIGINGVVRAEGVPVTSAVSTGITSTLSSVSPASQFAVGGSLFGIATFRVATQGAGTQANISELEFTTTGQDAIVSITVNGITRSVNQGGVTIIPGLNINTSSTGVDIPVTVLLSGFQGSTSGGSLISSVSPVALTLSKVKASTGSGSIVYGTTPVSSNQMTLVASKPTVTMSRGGGTFTLGTEAKVGEFTVSADANGRIALQSLSLYATVSGITNPSITGWRIADGNTTIPGSSASEGSSLKTIISFPSYGYEISPGMSKTFSVYGVVNGTAQSGVEQSIVTQFNSSYLFSWKDVLTNSTQTGEKLYNYPTNGYRVTGIVTPTQVERPIAMCGYSAPLPNCSWVPGPDYVQATGCGKIQQCTVTKIVEPTPTRAPILTPTPVGNGAYTVLSPNGGEVFKIGGTMTIKWKVTGLTPENNSVVVQVHDNSAPYKSLYTGYLSNPVNGDVVASEGSQTITIPTNTTPGMYTVYISGANGWDESDAYFTVNTTGVAQTNTPSAISVLASSIKKLEQVYTKYALGGVQSSSAQTIELSAPTSITPTTEVINFTGLKRGAGEARVSSLKTVLRSISPTVSLGCHNLNVANILYGPTTEECVKIFQNLNELEPTGIVDEATNKALNKVIIAE